MSNVIIQSALNSFGEVVVSGNAAVSNLEGFCYSTVNGFHQAAVNYIGQNVGAQQYDRVKKIFRLCMLYASAAGLLVGGALTIFRRPLLSIYITDSQEALEVGMIRVFYTSAPYFIYGLLDAAAGSLRGLGASTISMLISVLGICGKKLRPIPVTLHSSAASTATYGWRTMRLCISPICRTDRTESRLRRCMTRINGR